METKNTLIIDDDKSVREELAKILTGLNMKVDTATSGKEGVEKVEEHKNQYDLIFVDLNMPEMDGIEVLESINNVEPEIHVIMITSHGSVRSAVEAMKLGAIDYIEKPVKKKEIENLMELIIRRENLREKDADDYNSNIELAKKAIENGNLESADKFVKKAIGMDPSRPNGFNILGGLTEIKGNMTGAMKFYRAALALDPSYKPANVNLTRISDATVDGDIIMDVD